MKKKEELKRFEEVYPLNWREVGSKFSTASSETYF
jgi:hypothetical protein